VASRLAAKNLIDLLGLRDVGAEVVRRWSVVHRGDHGNRIKADPLTVERFPYLGLPGTKNYDPGSIPSGTQGR
jgi:hypothetical protein